MQLFMPFYALPTLVTFLAPPIPVQIPKTMAIERNPAISVMESRLFGNFSYSNDLRFPPSILLTMKITFCPW